MRNKYTRLASCLNWLKEFRSHQDTELVQLAKLHAGGSVTLRRHLIAHAQIDKVVGSRRVHSCSCMYTFADMFFYFLVDVLVGTYALHVLLQRILLRDLCLFQNAVIDVV